jgi:hypothetical protein
MYQPTFDDRKEMAKCAIKSKLRSIKLLTSRYQNSIDRGEREWLLEKIRMRRAEVDAMRHIYKLFCR